MNRFKKTAVIAFSLLFYFGCGDEVDKLIGQLNAHEYAARQNAVEALVKIGERAVEPLIAALKDRDWKVRHNAAEALGNIGDKRAVTALLSYLKDWHISKSVASALANIGWAPSSIEDEIHFMVAKRDNTLLNIWVKTKQVLLKDVESNIYSDIENALYAFISLGNKEIIPELIASLNGNGNKTMAEAYLNCGNDELRDAAVAWARNHGYSISSVPGSASVTWIHW
jgi:hypothetical protein